MCGIVGYFTLDPKKLKNEKEHFAHDALILDSFRGFDSTGIITVDGDFNVVMSKAAMPGYEFIYTDDFRKRTDEAWIFIGHNRKATKGKVSKANAHPFKYGQVYMVHNGTAMNMGSNLPYKLKSPNVDSQMIAYNLSKVAPEEAHEIIKRIQGSYALAWVDARDESFNLVRNSERPMHFGYDAGRQTMYFMSDGKHLDVIRDRSYFGRNDLTPIYQLACRQHLKFKKGSLVPEVADITTPFYDSRYDPESYAPRVITPQTRSPAMKPSEWANVPESSQRSSRNTKRRHRPLSPRSVPSSHRIYLNGQERPLLESTLHALSEHDLDPGMHLRFKPKSYDGYIQAPEEDKFGVVFGEVEHPIWGNTKFEGIIHDVPQSAIYSMDHYWTVRPIGIIGATKESHNTLGYLCRLENFKPEDYEDIGDDAEFADAAVPFEFDDERKTDVDPSGLTSVVGPKGQIISIAKFNDLTRRGCINCQTDLNPEDYEDIWWVGEGEEDPLCGKCCDILSKPDEEATKH